MSACIILVMFAATLVTTSTALGAQAKRSAPSMPGNGVMSPSAPTSPGSAGGSVGRPKSSGTTFYKLRCAELAGEPIPASRLPSNCPK